MTMSETVWRAVGVKTTLALVLLASVGCARISPASTPAPGRDMSQAMESFLQAHLDSGGFMGSVLVARGDEILLSQGYGKANLELDVANTPETVFRLGSLTKQFTAAAILQLQDQGRLNVNDTLDQYLPDAPHAGEVTLSQLLSHSSGIHDSLASPSLELRQAHSPDEMISLGQGQPLDFPPGSQYRYCNLCYIILGRIVEMESGQPYSEYMAEHIFQPAGMTATGVDDAGPLVPDRADGYAWDGQTYRNAEFIDMANVGGAGVLHSTVGDMYRWDRALYTDAILSPEGREAFFTPRIRRSEGLDYAFGWVIKETPEHTLAMHSGEVNGFVAFVIRDPATQLYVVALSNVENPAAQGVAEGLAAIALGEPYAMPGQSAAFEIDPAVLQQYAGSYEVTPDMVLAITEQAGHLFARLPDQPEFELFPTSETEFYATVGDVRLRFEVATDGTVTGVVILEGGREIHAARLG